ncbi:MAG: hypothetical protein QNI87_01725 [Erythrobacter sp.]|uniref:hypothetical protein n=1 Tax=Erythrobacter sp. TaxID=1042 RepID=UPI00263399B8|nr:hypothetical protein [Erythrobacter sp.]MDJ0977234.1 hypothetical protein [Erythrobacter sp.]
MFASIALIAAAPIAPSASCEAVTTLNVVDIQPGRAIEARRYYETGWAAARKVALERGYISDYSLLVSQAGQSEEPEIVLITRYRDKRQFAAGEERFQEIFAELDLPQPLLVDGLSRDAILGPFRGADDYRLIFSSGGSCAIPGHEAS